MVKPDGQYTVTYNSDNHVSVITQMWGSVWPRTLPYCLINVGIAAVLQYLKHFHDVNLAITDKGHSLMTLFVAFLIVSRVTISLGRYNEARGYLGVMYKESRELIQCMAVFSKENQSDSAKAWRFEVAYYTCLLLRLAMAVIDYPTTKVPAWNVPELNGEPKEKILNFLQITGGSKRWAHAHRGDYEESMRVPITMAYVLRCSIYSSKDRIDGGLETWQMTRMFGDVDSFMTGYYGMRKFMSTPFPFPLVQMARTFLFVWLYTLPFALLSDVSSPGAHFAVIFLVTFGFVGLETVSIEMDNPFGDDDNDFNNLGMAYTAFEDTYMMMNDVDGQEWADKLRKAMKGFDDVEHGEFLPNESLRLLEGVQV